MMMKKFGAGLACLGMLSGCVSNPSNISAAYVNPVQYASMACEDVHAELSRVSAKEADLTNRQQQTM